MKNYFNAIFNFINYASIDVAFGAVCCLYPLLKIYQIGNKELITILIFNAVLVFYWADHFFDTKKKHYKVISNRHKLILNNKAIFLFIGVILTANNVYLITVIYTVIYLPAIPILTILVGIYLLQEKLTKFKQIISKEVVVSITYTLVIFLPTWCNNINLFNYQISYYILPILLFLTVMQNMFMVNLIEVKTDKLNVNKNMAISFGSNKIKQLNKILLAVQILHFILFVLVNNNQKLILYAFILLVIGSLQHLIKFMYNKQMLHNEGYRLFGEASFFLPIIVAII